MTGAQPRIRRDVEADREAEERARTEGLPGRLYVRREGKSYVAITLDVPNTADHIGPELQPVIAKLVQGFALRHVRRGKLAATASGTVSVAPDYVSLEVLPDDADHYIVALAAVLKTAKVSRPRPAGEPRDCLSRVPP